MRVFLWPGYGTEEDDPKEDIFPTEPFTGAPYAAPGGCFHPICPRGSVCIPSYECPSCSIHYIKDMASTRLKVRTRIIDGWPMQCMYFIVVYRGWVRPTQPLFNFNYASCFITHTSNQYLYCCCFIAVSFNQFSLQFLCGVSLGTEGWLCCSLHFIKNALSLVRQAPRHPAMDDHGECEPIGLYMLRQKAGSNKGFAC